MFVFTRQSLRRNNPEVGQATTCSTRRVEQWRGKPAGDGEYYYESERVGGQVVKQYVGPGQVALLIDSMNAERELSGMRNGRRSGPRLKNSPGSEAMIVPLDDFTRLVAEGALLAAGYIRAQS